MKPYKIQKAQLLNDEKSSYGCINVTSSFARPPASSGSVSSSRIRCCSPWNKHRITKTTELVFRGFRSLGQYGTVTKSAVCHVWAEFSQTARHACFSWNREPKSPRTCTNATSSSAWCFSEPSSTLVMLNVHPRRIFLRLKGLKRLRNVAKSIFRFHSI